ncbi:unnamed protein product [Microthlaspi erraticum]|uniref:Uncharacterized protein n=1 Tax=Microthlaspi erraticum TaxID=1685480 RepID=A0A6D2KXL5_9BRAS|nr:unnamed protein product [Microthlaspi erraticum]
MRSWASDLIWRVVRPKSKAWLSADRIASASIIADVMKRSADYPRVCSPPSLSMKIYPVPPVCVSFLHDPSVNQIIAFRGLLGGVEWIVCRWVFWLNSCAICHSLASDIALVIVASGEKTRSSKMRWFLEVQMTQQIHGKRGPAPMPVGGRQIQSLDAMRVVVKLGRFWGLMMVLRGALDKTC